MKVIVGGMIKKITDPDKLEGRDLDGAVAVEVMEVIYQACCHRISILGVWEACPQYSTDMAAAWLVVNRMRKLGWTFKLTERRATKKFSATFATAFNEGGRGHGRMADSMPESICKTALLTMRENKTAPKGR